VFLATPAKEDYSITRNYRENEYKPAAPTKEGNYNIILPLTAEYFLGKVEKKFPSNSL
jgi:hypothetical protein